MKSKNLQKMKLNKTAISKLSQNEVTGGVTITTTIDTLKTITLCGTHCQANTVDDYSCTYCTIA
jgi:hypothetical protein